jgi:hypothetical protein
VRARSTPPCPTDDTRHSVFADVDGDGAALPADFSAVKKRFFDNLPPATTTVDLLGAVRISPAAGINAVRRTRAGINANSLHPQSTALVKSSHQLLTTILCPSPRSIG